MRPLLFQNQVKLSQLSQSHCRVQFADSKIQAHNGMILKASVIADMIMAMVRVGIRTQVEAFIIGNHGAALAACDRFHGVKGKTTHLAEGSQGLPVQCPAGGLAGVLDENQVFPVTEVFDFVDSCHGAAHVNG